MITLTEGFEFIWKDTVSPFGIQTLPHLRNGAVLASVKNPWPRQVVLTRKGNTLVPAVIVDGEFEVNGTVTNRWIWQELNEFGIPETRVEGRGEFYKLPELPHSKPVCEKAMAC